MPYRSTKKANEFVMIHQEQWLNFLQLSDSRDHFLNDLKLNSNNYYFGQN